MSSSAPVVPQSEAQRWREWQDRGLDADRRRDVAMKWVMAIIAIALGVLFGRLL
jgi:hypothetical protein